MGLNNKTKMITGPEPVCYYYPALWRDHKNVSLFRKLVNYTCVNESDPAHTPTGNSFKTRVHQQTWWTLLIRRAHLCSPPREIWCNNCGMCGTILDLSCLHWPTVHCYSTWLQLTIPHIALLLHLKCAGGRHVVLISALWRMWPFLCV